MIVIYATVSEAVRDARDLEGIFKDVREVVAHFAGKDVEHIVACVGVVEHLTKPYAAMLSVDFLDRSTDIAEANSITAHIATTLRDILSPQVENRSVLAYPTLRNTVPPIKVE